MARCFCGCGARLRLGGRIANSYGKTAALLCDRLDARDPDTADFDLETFTEIGYGFRQAFADAVHGVASLNDIDRDEWVRWRNAAFAEDRAYREETLRPAQ